MKRYITELLVIIMFVNIVVMGLSMMMGDASPMWFRLTHVFIAVPSFIFVLYIYWKRW